MDRGHEINYGRRDRWRDMGKRGRNSQVTVCIAAICEANRIVMVSDKMVTAGDAEFDRNVSKIVPMRSSTILIAGDLGTQGQLLEHCTKTKTISCIREQADIYHEEYLRIRRKLAENAILKPMGLSLQCLTDKHNELRDEVFKYYAERLQKFDVPSLEIETIVTGIDQHGPHIYVVDPSGVHDCSLVGYAAIGSGKYHAEREFVVSAHTIYKSMCETLVTAYTAKKQAEIAPGVGAGTVMRMVGPQRPELEKVLDIDAFDRIYKQARAKSDAVFAEAYMQMESHIQDVIRRSNHSGAHV